MVSELYAGLTSLKVAFDLAKGLKDIDDATRRKAAVIELQEKILSAQSTQATLVETIGELKKRVAELEAWEADKQRYELKSIAPGVFAYRLKNRWLTENQFMISVQHASSTESHPFFRDLTWV